MITADGGWEKDVESSPVPTAEEIAEQWAELARQYRADVHGDGERDCPPEEPPF